MLCAGDCGMGVFQWHGYVTLISLHCIFPWRGHANTTRVCSSRWLTSSSVWDLRKDCLHLQACNSFGNLAPELQSRYPFMAVCLNAAGTFTNSSSEEQEKEKNAMPLALILSYIWMNRAIKRCRALGNILEGNYSIILGGLLHWLMILVAGELDPILFWQKRKGFIYSLVISGCLVFQCCGYKTVLIGVL